MLRLTLARALKRNPDHNQVWGVDPSALRNASVGRAPEPPSMRRVTSSLTNMSQVMFDGFSEYTAWYTPGGR